MNGNRHHPLYRPYLLAIATFGLVVVALSGFRLVQDAAGHQWLILASLTLVTGLFALKIPGTNSKITVADTLVCANTVLFGPAAGTVTAALDGLTGSLRCKTVSRRVEFTLFNTAAMALSAFLGGQAFSGVAGTALAYRNPLSAAGSVLSGLGVLALVYFCSNSLFVAAIVSLERRENVLACWRGKYLWTAVNYVAAASVAGLLAETEGSITALTVLTVLTVLAAIYASSRSFVDAAGQVLRHEQFSASCMSTVEMLADAIGSKEQWSRGDSDRLRVYARGLAQAFGFTDAAALRSIETAAVLHDVGKVAVPEKILCKPGALTFEEFEHIKIHPTVAADLLASADFPGTVTDCVRHLRERWDGAGYPNRLKRNEIPFEARILAVADAYTVLTSDRPYRPRYSPDDALDILRSDAGKRFDPRVVETFFHALPNLEANIRERTPTPAPRLESILPASDEAIKR